MVSIMYCLFFSFKYYQSVLIDRFTHIVFNSIQRRRLISHANAKCKSEKFPPPHLDGTLGYPLGSSHRIDPTFDLPDVPFSSMNFSYWSGQLVDDAAVGAPRKKQKGKASARIKELAGM